eukprot:Filipodium_phascolosomae@DN3461_c0_g1_i1.p1
MDHVILRLLLFNHRKFKEKMCPKTRAHIALQCRWRKEMFPISDLEIKNELDSGMMYWMGRDSSFRPLLVVRLARMPHDITSLQVKRVCVFCVEYILRYGLIPGKVETLSVLIDMQSVGLHRLPINTLKDLASTLTYQYAFRLHRMYIVNSPPFVYGLWNLMKNSGVLTEIQVQKIRFLRGSAISETLLQDFAPHQIEECYGGSTKAPKKYYPFPLPAGPFSSNSTDGPNADALPNVWKILSEKNYLGTHWESSDRKFFQANVNDEESRKILAALSLSPYLEVVPSQPIGPLKDTSALAQKAAPPPVTMPITERPQTGSNLIINIPQHDETRRGDESRRKPTSSSFANTARTISTTATGSTNIGGLAAAKYLASHKTEAAPDASRKISRTVTFSEQQQGPKCHVTTSNADSARLPEKSILKKQSDSKQHCNCMAALQEPARCGLCSIM